MLQALAKIGGISALSLGVMYLLYREMIRRNIFSRLSSTQTFCLFSLLAVLIAGITTVALLKTDGNFAAAIGANNTINQGVIK